MSTYNVPSTVRGTIHKWAFNLITILRRRFNFYPYYANEEIEHSVIRCPTQGTRTQTRAFVSILWASDGDHSSTKPSLPHITSDLCTDWLVNSGLCLFLHGSRGFSVAIHSVLTRLVKDRSSLLFQASLGVMAAQEGGAGSVKSHVRPC